MTAQISERLRYQGEWVSMCTEPLGEYFRQAGIDPRFAQVCTALWRGYKGAWEIVDDRLYLIELSGTFLDGSKASLATFFPDFPKRVFAHWYSGTIRIPQGDRIQYVHMGYGTVFERDVMLEVERGVVKATKVRNNAPAPESADAEHEQPLP